MSELKMKDVPKTIPHSIFEMLKSTVTEAGVARLGRLAVANRRVMDTPNYIAVSSRGAIPHLTPDNVARHTSFDAVYMALEDCKYYLWLLYNMYSHL